VTRGTGRRPAPPSPPDPSTIREIHRRLASEHGPLVPSRRWEPLEELILTILSQNTSDVNSGRAYEALRRRFPTWEGLAEARPSRVAAAIRAGGLANVKAPRILAVLREIRRREGGFDLSWMGRAPDADIEEYLSSLPGVGPKTVACVLAFSLGRPALPVDTHVHRVGTRLGFLPPGMPATRAHAVMAELVPPRMRIGMHVGLIRHGRRICKAGRPRCEECALADLCPTAPAVLGGRPPPKDAGRTGASVSSG
jgi:endonuclease-3